MTYENRPNNLNDFALDPALKMDILGPLFWRHILFLPTWTGSMEFVTGGRAKRKEYYDVMKPLEMPATKEIPWIWFGEYPKPGLLPMYNGKSVVRILYKHFVNPTLPDVRKLKPMTQDRSNVNPHLYFPACGQQYFTRAPKSKGPLFDGIVKETIARIIEDGYNLDEYTDDEIKKFTIDENTSDAVVTEALRRMRNG